MSKLARIKRRAYWGALVAMTLTTAACSSSDGESTATTAPVTSDAPVETTTSVEPATTESTEDESEPTPTTAVGGRYGEVVIVDAGGIVQPDGAWSKRLEPFYVWGVEADDVLNVRSGPGIDQDLVATLSPDSGGLRIYDVIERVGSTNWVVIEINDDGGVGWVSDQFLRPQPPVGSPVVTGTASLELMLLVTTAIEGLTNSTALGGLVGSQGLTIAPFTFVGDETVTLTADQVWNEEEKVRTWGFETGTGDPIMSSLTDYLAALAARTAITSTAEIGYDELIGGGNTINNLEQIFPGATVVEYYHPGTDFYGGLDWTSVRFVFVEEDGGLVLRALVSDQWEI